MNPRPSVDALTAACPHCHQPAGQPCVYLTNNAEHRAGQPAKRPHLARFPEAHRRAYEQARRRITPARWDTRQAAIAEREFDRHQWRQLRTWLASYATLFTHGQLPPRTVYTVHAALAGPWWELTVPEVRGAVSQVDNLADAEAYMREVIHFVRQIHPASFDLEIQIVPRTSDIRLLNE